MTEKTGSVQLINKIYSTDYNRIFQVTMVTG